MERLLASVGTSPLPVLLGLRHLDPVQVTFLASEQTSASVDRIVDLAKQCGWKGEHVLLPSLSDPFAVELAQFDLEGLPHCDVLYSGGTAPMSVAVYDWWASTRPVDGAGTAAFVVDPAGALVDHCGGSTPLTPMDGLTLDSLLELHGVQRDPGRPGAPAEREGGLTDVVADLIDGAADARGRRQITDVAQDFEHVISHVVAALSALLRPDATTERNVHVLLPSEPGVQQGVAELDVVVVDDWRAWLGSCKFGATQNVDAAAYEAVARARLVGGELTQVAVFTNKTPNQVNAARRRFSRGLAQVGVFGIEDVRAAARVADAADREGAEVTEIGRWLLP